MEYVSPQAAKSTLRMPLEQSRRRSSASMLRFVLMACMAAVTTGCKQSVDLSAVRSLSVAAASAQASFHTLADDYYASCLRQVDWSQAAGKLTIATVKKKGTTHATTTPRVTITDVPPPKSVDTSCTDSLEASKEWKDVNDAVLGYFIALGDVAGTGSSTTNDYGLPALASQLTAAKLFPADSNKATGLVSGIQGLINGFFDAERSNDIASFAPKADGDLAGVIEDLKAAATDNYEDIVLFEEQRSIDYFFEDNFAAAGPTADPIAMLKYRQDWKSESEQLDKRKVAAESYVGALEKLESAHHAIVEAIQDNDLREAISVIKTKVAALRPDLDAIDKAFK
jgi:hypothetical protein